MPRFNRTPEKTERARNLRRTMTKAEVRLWMYLRDASFGVSFRKQHPRGPFYLDFYCPSLKLAIELDGGQHAEQQDEDEARTEFLRKRGVHVIRFWNNEVLEGIDGVGVEIGDAIRARKFERGEL